MKNFNKKKLPSRHTSLGPDKAPQRSFYYAMNLKEKEMTDSDRVLIMACIALMACSVSALWCSEDV